MRLGKKTGQDIKKEQDTSFLLLPKYGKNLGEKVLLMKSFITGILYLSM